MCLENEVSCILEGDLFRRTVAYFRSCLLWVRENSLDSVVADQVSPVDSLISTNIIIYDLDIMYALGQEKYKYEFILSPPLLSSSVKEGLPVFCASSLA